jgi:hypothetical protein
MSSAEKRETTSAVVTPVLAGIKRPLELGGTLLADYLSSIEVSEDMPGILFNWNDEWVVSIVTSMNNYPGPLVSSAFLVLAVAPNITTTSFKVDLVNAVAQAGSGRSCGQVLVAPNSIPQFAHARECLSHFAFDAYIQANMGNIPVGSFLATISVMLDKTPSQATPSPVFAPPAPFRQLWD